MADPLIEIVSIHPEPIGPDDQNDHDAEPDDGLSRHDVPLAPTRRDDERDEDIEPEQAENAGDDHIPRHGRSPVHGMRAGLAAVFGAIAQARSRSASASSLKRQS